MSTSVIVLLSGGIDSSACIHYYRNQEADVRALFVDYGHASAKRERDAARQITTHFSIPLEIVAAIGFPALPTGRVLGRNLFLVSIALMSFSKKQGIIALGVHAGTDYEDCSSSFLDKVNSVVDVYAGGSIVIRAPFIKFTKKEVWEYACETNIPLEQTYSCERGVDQPCGSCRSCDDLTKLTC